MFHTFLSPLLHHVPRQSDREEREGHPGDRGQVRRGEGADRRRQRQQAAPTGSKHATATPESANTTRNYRLTYTNMSCCAFVFC